MSMEYKKKITEAQEQIKQRVVEISCGLFCEKGINNVKMTEIAEKADVGVATLYRWFVTKDRLVILSGIFVWNTFSSYLEGVFTSQVFMKKNGYGRISDLLGLVYAAYKGTPQYLRFLRDFDSYVSNEHISQKDLSEYEESVLQLRVPAREAYLLGLKDGSVREIDFDVFYFSAARTLMAFAQKLLCSGKILKSDSVIDPDLQFRSMIDVFLYYIKAKEDIK
jgi:AcrR family transcriptional regulator